jgi:hypothetical protein
MYLDNFCTFHMRFFSYFGLFLSEFLKHIRNAEQNIPSSFHRFMEPYDFDSLPYRL